MLVPILIIILVIFWTIGTYVTVKHDSGILGYLIPLTALFIMFSPLLLIAGNVNSKTFYLTEIRNEISKSLEGYQRHDYNPYLIPASWAIEDKKYWRGTEEFEYISQNKSQFTFK